jgi:hypothetical protein
MDAHTSVPVGKVELLSAKIGVLLTSTPSVMNIVTGSQHLKTPAVRFPSVLRSHHRTNHLMKHHHHHQIIIITIKEMQMEERSPQSLLLKSLRKKKVMQKVWRSVGKSVA